jgi:hypothetical protein
LSLSPECDLDRAAEQLADAAACGIKIRTRALATTLFARLMLGDVFLHGIGGAKYDQVTDDIAYRFFGFSLPEYATVSATLRLPIEHISFRSEQLRDVNRQMRELSYHPERYVAGSDPPVQGIVAEKLRWLRSAKTPQNAQARHRAIAGANAALQPFVSSQRDQLERERRQIEHRLRVDSILDSREYSFCLLPRACVEQLLK